MLKNIFVFLAVFSISAIANAKSPYEQVKVIIHNNTNYNASCNVSFNNNYGSWLPGHAFPNNFQGRTKLEAHKNVAGYIKANKLVSNFFMGCHLLGDVDVFRNEYVSSLVSISPDKGMAASISFEGMTGRVYPTMGTSFITVVLHLDPF